MFSEKFLTSFQYLIPHHALSRLMGKLANCRWRWFKNLVIKKFIKTYQVDMSSALEPNPENYPDFNSFFTRALKPGARPIVQGENAIACPVDGFVSQATNITDGKIFQAKNFHCTALQLLGGDQELAKIFNQGKFTTLYLAPKNYHRVHMPYTGTLKKMIYVPGQIFSVNPGTVSHVPNLFARNERVITYFETEIGPMAVILVGAMIVAGIATVWSGDVAPNPSRQIQTWNYQDSPLHLQKGDEMGLFKMGSTVIVLFAENRVTWAANIQPEKSVHLGQLLATID